MEMVAASKMRRAQDRMEVGKPYARRVLLSDTLQMLRPNMSYVHATA